VRLDILEVLDCAVQLPAVDGLGSLAGVLVGDTEVGAPRAGGFGVLDVGGGVADLKGKTMSVQLLMRMSQKPSGRAL